MIRQAHLIPLLKGHITVYFLFMVILCLLIYFIFILIIFLSFRIKNKKPRINCLISFLRFILPVISFGFFGQIFLLLTTFFDCRNGNTYVSAQLKCRTGNWFTYFCPFIVLAILLHICIAVLTNLLYYKSIFEPSISDILLKTTPMPDISLIIAKVGIILTFILDNSDEGEHWVILFFLMLFSGMNAYTNIFYNHRLNRLIFMLNIIFSLISFVGFFILFIGKMLKSLGYDGSIFLFSILIIIIFLFVFLYKNKDFDFVLIDYRNLSNPEEYANYIIKYFKLIMHKHNSRNYSTILKSYISTIEETCTIVDCPLKDYLKNLEEGNDSQYLLLKYMEKIFKYGISKFKNDPMLKNSYSMFLLIQLNHKKQAMIELKTISEEQISFSRRYSIHRCKKLIEKWPDQSNSYYFHYRTNANEFKELILKTTTLYYEFWSLLYKSKSQHSDNFERLFKIGNEILDLNKKMDDLYQVLINTKTNNAEIYNLYKEFIENISKNEVKNNKIQSNKNSIFSEIFENKECNYTNLNIGFLKENDAVRYILISGDKKNLGIIIDCSISACMVFGYTKGEIIGKHLNLFIPEIFHYKHNVLLSAQSNINNFQLFDNLYQKKKYNPSFLERCFFGVFKSKFIKNLKLKIYFIKTEENVVTFVIEVLKDIPYMTELVKDRNIPYCNKDERCCVLTDENFLIYSFTANSVEQLGISYYNVKSKNSIIPYIKQLYEDYINSINNIKININSHYNSKNEMISVESSRLSEREISSKVSYEVKQKIKNDLINKKYGKKCQITWYLNKKINKNKNKVKKEENSEINGKYSRISHRGSSYNFSQNKTSNENREEKEFLMEVRKAVLDNRLLGYYFFFSKLGNSECKNFMIYNSLNNQNEKDKGEELNKLIKYKVIFKTPQKPLFKNNDQNEKNNNVSCTAINAVNTNDISKDDDKSLSNILKEGKINKDSNASFVDNSKNSLYSEMELNVLKPHKFSSAIGISDNSTEEIVVDENFCPKSRINFYFDLDNICYSLEKDTSKSNVLKSKLQKMAIAKINEYHEYLKSLKNNKILDLSKSKDSENDYNSNNDEDEENEEEEDDSLSNSSIHKNTKDDINIRKSITLKNRTNSQMEKVSPMLGKSSTLRPIKEAKDENNGKIKKDIIKITNNNNLQEIKKAQEKEMISNYYKVNLSNIHFMIFDFNKDMIVEGDKKEIIFKIDNIINSSKNKNNIINIGKDERYPFISYKNTKEEKKNNNKVEEQNKLLNNNINSIINEEKSFERKINDSINDKKEEEAIKILKNYSIISFVVLILFSGLILCLNIYYFREIRNILQIIKNIINIKYTNSLGLYYVRELTLVNYNTKDINSYYTELPAKNKTTYISLIRTKLIELFIESQNCIKQILSSDFSPSKDTKENLTKTIISAKYFLNNNYGSIDADILSILLQYNSALYNLASSYEPVEENHPDLYNYLHNGYNNYEKIMHILISKFNKELNNQKKYILIIIIICLIIFLIVFVIFCILMTLSYISSAKRRVNYMQVFYDINIDSIKTLMSNCELLMEKLKKKSGKREEEELDESSKENKTIKKNKQTEISSRNILMINNHDNKNYISLSRSSKVFIFFYLLFMTILYCFFPYNCITLYNISNRSIFYSDFFIKLNEFDSSILDNFNAYRQFLFDNGSIIQDMMVFDFLVSSEIKTYISITDNNKIIDKFINEYLGFDDAIVNLMNKDLCSFTMTDYFEAREQCLKKYKNLLDYDFTIFLTFFIQTIRNLKNIAKYWLKTRNIYGNLTIYNIESWKSSKPNENGIFRLEIFNDKELHSEVNLMFINIALPYLDESRKEFIKKLTLENFGSYFYIYFSLFIVCVIILYFFYLVPKIRYLTNFIYKTKKMLSLIPMSILANQSDIKALLKLN